MALGLRGNEASKLKKKKLLKQCSRIERSWIEDRKSIHLGANRAIVIWHVERAIKWKIGIHVTVINKTNSSKCSSSFIFCPSR